MASVGNAKAFPIRTRKNLWQCTLLCHVIHSKRWHGKISDLKPNRKLGFTWPRLHKSSLLYKLPDRQKWGVFGWRIRHAWDGIVLTALLTANYIIVCDHFYHAWACVCSTRILKKPNKYIFLTFTNSQHSQAALWITTSTSSIICHWKSCWYVTFNSYAPSSHVSCFITCSERSWSQNDIGKNSDRIGKSYPRCAGCLKGLFRWSMVLESLTQLI